MRTLLTTLHSKFIHPSLALPCLAAYCGADGGELRIREFTVHEPKEQVLAALLAEQPDVIAFSVYLWNRRETLELVDALAVARPGLRLVLGGPEVSFDGPDLFDRHPGLTALIRGEGELPVRALLSAWHHQAEPGVIPRLCLRAGDGLHHPTAQFDLTYPLHNFFPQVSKSVYIQAQYFAGYGESLLDYDKRTDSLRLGVALWR